MDRKINEAIEIPDGVKVGEYIRQMLIENSVLNPDGSLQGDLEVRVFDNRRTSNVLSRGTDRDDWETWAWPYFPTTWSYNNLVADSSSSHTGGFVFYKKEGMEYIIGVPGGRRFVVPPLECLVAVFKYKS